MRIAGARTLADEVRAAGVAGDFVFLGHVAEPSAVLAACDCLIKPTRDANPWGRDILEAMAQGRPVISYGRDATFVEPGVTGLLMDEFDATVTARELLRLANDRDSLRAQGANAKQRIRRLCDPAAQAAELAELWRAAYATRQGRS